MQTSWFSNHLNIFIFNIEVTQTEKYRILGISEPSVENISLERKKKEKTWSIDICSKRYDCVTWDTFQFYSCKQVLAQQDAQGTVCY